MTVCIYVINQLIDCGGGIFIVMNFECNHNHSKCDRAEIFVELGKEGCGHTTESTQGVVKVLFAFSFYFLCDQETNCYELTLCRVGTKCILWTFMLICL